ncbi:MAG: DUF354 domain-containing protein [Muribaculaceae bacterium]|nr:DUF354 domain-containing protein [Muribaculaceae bacterium]
MDKTINRVLIYIGHPAQYHFFKNMIKVLSAEGVAFRVLIKTKDILEELLVEDGLPFHNIQTDVRRNTKIGILKASIQRTMKVLKEAREFKADLLIGTDSSIAQAGWLLRKPAITTLEDDEEIIKNLARLTYPFTTHILVPNVCSVGKWEKKKIGYEGYMKLAYLHPNYFKPDKKVINEYGIKDKYCLVRLAKLSAHHDVGIKGLTADLVAQIIQIAENNGCQVLISSEAEMDERFKPYQLRIRHTDIHHIMAFASLLISDSQSMSVEASMLGTPNIRFSDFSGRISVLEELENKYHLTTGIKTSQPNRLIDSANEILSNSDVGNVYHQRYLQMLSDKIDVTAFLAWFVKDYPRSLETIQSNSNYQNQFK